MYFSRQKNVKGGVLIFVVADDAISQSEQICGYCYTQLADVEQEMNGLLTREHQYKFDPEQIKDIQDLC